MFNVYTDNDAYKAHSTESATLLYAQLPPPTVSIVTEVMQRRERELFAKKRKRI